MTVLGRAVHLAAMNVDWCFIAIPKDISDTVNTETPATTVNPMATRVAMVLVDG
jgi:hypothetical protein